jgi:ribosomal protein S18 acetylase RimI-like enzyme
MLSRAAFAAAAYETDEPIGFIMMLKPTKINSLFVHPSRVRQGIGAALWVSARTFLRHNHPTITAVELNSSSHAYHFYRALGFVQTADEQIKDGARFMPFSISLATPIDSPQNAAEVPFPSTSVAPFPSLKAR